MYLLAGVLQGDTLAPYLFISSYNVEKVCVSIRWEDIYFHALYSIIMAATVS